MATSDGKGQVAFSLAKKKKRKAPTAAALADFVDASNSQHETRPERTTPLVIPLSQPSTTLLKKPKNEEDEAAAQVLMESAERHFQQQQTSGEGTNFSADGSLTISSAANTFEKKPEEDDAVKFKRDLEERAEDIPVDSNVYAEVPIGEFGAALLRGMGWTGQDNSSKKQESDDTMPRPHRLGLGATPKLPPPPATGRMRRPDQVDRDKRLAQQQQEYQGRREKQKLLDKQQTLQNGSIVAVASDGKRARMIQLMGVPGLNRVLVQYEGESSSVSVKRGDVTLVSRDELETRPFQEVESRPNVKKEEPDRDNGRHEEDRSRRKQEERTKRDDRHDDRRRRDNDGDRKRSRDDPRRDDPRRDDRSRERRRTDEDARDKKRRRDEPEDAHHWLIPNIRVRVVTKKLSSRQYKQKGLVLDVTHGGANATLQMPDGQLLDRVPERYLETALPKVGGNAIILTGKHRFAKGKLLERSGDSGMGVIQVFEDMNVVKLSLDDIAEWCGPLDDDMEL